MGRALGLGYLGGRQAVGRDEQHSARLQDSLAMLEHPLFSTEVFDDAEANYLVEGLVGKIHRLGIHESELGPLHGIALPCRREAPLVDVDLDDLGSRPGDGVVVEPVAAPHVQDTFARLGVEPLNQRAAFFDPSEVVVGEASVEPGRKGGAHRSSLPPASWSGPAWIVTVRRSWPTP